MGGIRKKELVTIGDLHTYLSSSNAQSQKDDFLCKARIVSILQQNGWSYVSCTGGSRKLDKYGTSLRCSRCVSPNVTGVARFRVELAFEDGKDIATFMVFDTEMSLTHQIGSSDTSSRGGLFSTINILYTFSNFDYNSTLLTNL